MSLSLIPDTAPFNVEQRAWLNGFLAGWLGMQEGPIANSVPAFPEPVAAPTPAAELPWHDPTMPLADRLDRAEGRPIADRLMAAMAQLDCGACGYICRTYSEAIADGSESSLTLCTPGGAETSKVLKRLVKEQKPGAGTNGAVVRSPGMNGVAGPDKHAWSRKNPYPARVLRSDRLNRPGSDKDTRHVELDLGDSGLKYKVGDSLGVLPTNCGELVEEILAALGSTGEEAVEFDGAAILASEALQKRCCLTETTEGLVNLLVEAAEDRDETRWLQSLLEDDSPIAGWDVLDLLRRVPSARPPVTAIITALSPLRPRLYSISSSPRRHAGQVHLTVGRVAYERNGRLRKGVASTMFADRLAPGETVRIFVQESHGFTLPDDPAAPMIMIGPGTGIAPFRAFLHERDAIGATGRHWLFFGDQRGSCDFLYEEELRDLSSRGLLTRLDTAFSRDQDRKVYVQHRMREHGQELFRWLEDGAYLYVCGDAKRMAVDVDAALREVVQSQGGMSTDSAREYVARMSTEGRYRRDVY